MLKYSEIYKLAVPSIVANITTPLLSLVDTAIAGHLGSATYLAAIAVGGSIFNMIYFLFAFLRMGTSGRTAQAFGAENRTEVNKVLCRGIITAIVFAFLIIALQYPVSKIGLSIIDPDKETETMANIYFSILVYGAPAVLVNNCIYGWLIGIQRAKDTMVISICVNTVNIAVSIILVYIFGLGIEGIAYGTLTAQWTGALTGVYYIRRNGFRPVNKKILLAPYISKGQNVNIYIFLRTLCLVAVTVWFTRAGAAQGSVMLAVNSLLMQYFIIFSYFMDGFAYAGEALAGKFAGAGDNCNLKITISKLLKIGSAVAAFFTILYFFAGDISISLLSDDFEVREMAKDYRYWILTIPFAGFCAFVMDGIFVGITHTREMLESLIYAGLVFYLCWVFATPVIGNHGLWLAFVLYLITRGVFLLYKIRKVKVILYAKP